jgi:hypothetical protein
VAPPAVGTGSAIEPEMSMTASIRAGRVTEIQVVSALARVWPSSTPAGTVAGAPGGAGT